MLFNYDIYIYLVVLKVCAIKTNVPPDLFIPTDCLKVRYKYYSLVSNPCLKACQVQSLFTDQTEIFWPSLFHYRLLYWRMRPLSLKRDRWRNWANKTWWGLCCGCCLFVWFFNQITGFLLCLFIGVYVQLIIQFKYFLWFFLRVVASFCRVSLLSVVFCLLEKK